MTDTNNTLPTAAPVEPAIPFKGYTLQEMRARKAVNKVKIDLQKQKLISTLTPRRDTSASRFPTLSATIGNTLRYARIALFSYKIARRATKFYHSFRSAKGR